MPKRKIKRKALGKKKKKAVLFSPEMIKIFKGAGLAVATITLMVLVYMGEQAGVWFKASVLEAPIPFNGTVMPISKVPNFTHWNTQSTKTYDEISESNLVNLPAYDLNVMTFPDGNLEWGNPAHDNYRNTKIAYPVVYLGNYQLDHQENSGSHLAVDIKMPVGTPVHSIANGKVVKVAIQNTGFGNHIVIKHTNVPDPESPGTFTNLYSAFNHLSDVNVVEGQNVLRGEIIAKSGNTGTSTTPHLHFQIDRESAPWHPYWPFSWAEAQDAGLSFFEAVNAGLGMTKGKIHTVNPMTFIVQNIGYNSVVSSDPDATVSNPDPVIDPVEDPVEDPIEDPVIDPVEDPVEVVVEDGIEVIDDPFVSSPSDLFEFKITGESSSLINNGVSLTVSDMLGQTDDLSDTDEIRPVLTGVGTLLTKKLTKEDFSSGSAKVIVKSDEVGSATVTVGKSSHQISFIDKVQTIGKFHIEHDGNYQKSVVESVKIVALDANGNVTPAVNFSGVVSIKATDGYARIIPETIDVQDFDNGVAEIKIVVPNEDPVTLRAQNGALVGESTPIRVEESVVFTDINRTNENYEAIKYLKDNDIISGYSDGSFKPNQIVNRVEALKMLMLAFSIQAGTANELSFSDTDDGAWYSGTLDAAVSRGIVKGYEDGTFRPGTMVNRAEYMKMLFATNNITADSVSVKPYDDVEVDAWFAPYAFLGNKMNLLSPADTFNPGNAMTRAGVAKTIYRMKMIQDNNWVSYSG